MILLLGVLVGAVLGLTGAGGSVLAVPLLMAGLGWTMPQAAPVALLAVSASATFGTVVAWNVTYLRYRAALLMAAVGALLAPLGLHAAAVLPVRELTLLFVAAMVIVAGRMFVQARRAPGDTRIVRATVAGDSGSHNGRWIPLTSEGRIIWTPRAFVAISGIGAVTGFLSGLLGIGGGFVIVPSLRALSGLSMHSVVSTSLMAIALTAAGTFVWALVTHPQFPWAAAAPFALGAVAGIFIGRLVAPRIAGPALQQGFAGLMLVVAIVLLGHALTAR